MCFVTKNGVLHPTRKVKFGKEDFVRISEVINKTKLKLKVDMKIVLKDRVKAP